MTRPLSGLRPQLPWRNGRSRVTSPHQLTEARFRRHTNQQSAGDTESPSRVDWFHRITPYVLRHKRPLILSIVAAALWTATVTAVPLFTKVVVDDFVQHSTRSPGGALWWWLSALMLIAGARFVLSVIWRREGGRLSFAVQEDIRGDLFDRLQRADASIHNRLQSGQLVSRANTDVRLIQQLVSWVPTVVGSVGNVVVSIIIMVVLSPVLAVVVVLILCAVMVVMRGYTSKVYAAGWDAAQREADMTTAVEEAVTGVRVVKGFGQESTELGRVRDALAAMFGARMRAVRTRSPFLASLQAIPVGGQVLVLLVGGLLAMNGHLTLGILVSFSAYLTDLTGTTRVIGSILTMGPNCKAAVDRLGEILDLRPAVAEPENPRTPDKAEGRITLRNVEFGYDDDTVLSGFDLDVRPGETVALVGPAGSGKSTVLKLIPRFHDVAEGSVEIDGIDTRLWPLAELRHRIGVVAEDGSLFSDTVSANIAFGRPDATQEEIVEAAKAAAAHEYITELPDGYDTVIGEEGMTLSGGQRQRLSLARALLINPQILLLDDATSAVDVNVEHQIHANLEPLLAGRTVILIAYRESTLQLADRIVLIDEGKVIDEGTHAELLARSPQYQTLFGEEKVELVAEDLLAQARSGELKPTAGAWEEESEHTTTHGGLLQGDALSPQVAQALATLPPVRDVPDATVRASEAESTTARFTLRSFLRPYLGAFAIGLLFVIIDASIGLVGPQLIRLGIDHAILPKATGALLIVCSVMAVLSVLLWIDMRAETFWTGKTAERVLTALRSRIFAKLQKLGVDYYDRTHAGRTMTRMTSDVEMLAQLLQIGFINAMVSGATFIGMTIAIIAIDARLALVVAAVLPPAIVMTIWYRRRARRAYDQTRQRISSMNSYLQESITGVRTTHAFVRESVNHKHFRGLAGSIREANQDATNFTSIYVGFIEFLSVVAVVLALGVGSYLVDSGTLAIGAFLAFLLYLGQVFAPIQQMSQVFDIYQRARSGLSRLERLLAEPNTTPVAVDAEPVRDVKGEITLEGVRLRYQGASNFALREIDLHIPAGQRVAFIGRTGAGKSTIAKLVTRFYDPTEGQILVDGRPLDKLDLTGYRQRLGYVPQEPFLFSRTIRDNIAYGVPNASDAEVEAAALAVGAHEFITRLPGGYRHTVSERGRSLSAGQRQLLCLARALLVDPGILVLDEATSNLDMASERKVNRAMRVASAGRTTLVVTHRPQALLWVDRVVEIAAGEVVGDRRT